MRIFFILLACVTATSCVNLQPKPDTVRQFVLGPVDPDAGREDGTAAMRGSIYVGRPDLPGYLDGNRLQYRLDSGGVHALAGARWGEPIEEGVARALSEYLVQQGACTESGFYPWPRASSNTPRLRVRLHQFTATGDGTILVRANWRLELPDGDPMRGTYTSEELTWQPGDPESLVQGLNTGLEALAGAIADALSTRGGAER